MSCEPRLQQMNYPKVVLSRSCKPHPVPKMTPHKIIYSWTCDSHGITTIGILLFFRWTFFHGQYYQYPIPLMCILDDPRISTAKHPMQHSENLHPKSLHRQFQFKRAKSSPHHQMPIKEHGYKSSNKHNRSQ